MQRLEGETKGRKTKFDYTVSAGTLVMHATVCPSKADTIFCIISGVLLIPSKFSRTEFAVLYVAKKRAADGMDPAAATDKPRYKPASHVCGEREREMEQVIVCRFVSHQGGIIF
jgi:hypothetical protein